MINYFNGLVIKKNGIGQGLNGRIQLIILSF